MAEIKIAEITSVVEDIASATQTAFPKKTGGALLFATQQITQCLKSNDVDGALLGQKVGTAIADKEEPNFVAHDPVI